MASRPLRIVGYIAAGLIGLLIGIELISVGGAIAYLAWQVRRGSANGRANDL